MNNYKGSGDKVNLTAGVALTGGTPAAIGDSGLVIVPESSVSSGAEVAALTCGVFKMPKINAAIASTIHGAAESISVGDRLFWDATNSKVTKKAIGPFLGRAQAAATSGSAYVDVLMGEGSDFQAPIVVTAVLDQALNSATGTHALPGGKIPTGYVPLNWTYEVLTTFTSATDAATIALGIETQDTDGLKAAVAISNGANPWDAGVFVGVAAAGNRTTAERSIVAVIASEALTAGKLVLSVVCVRAGVTA